MNAGSNKIRGAVIALRVTTDYGSLRQGEIVSGVPWTTDGNECERTAANAAYAVTVRDGDRVKVSIVPARYLSPVNNRRASRHRPWPFPHIKVENELGDFLAGMISDGVLRRARDIAPPRMPHHWPAPARHAVSRFRSVTA